MRTALSDALDAHRSAMATLVPLGVWNQTAHLKPDKMTDAQIAEALEWIRLQGGRVVESVDQHKEGRAKYPTHQYRRFAAQTDGVDLPLYCTREQLRGRPNRGLSSMDRFIVEGLSRMLDKAEAARLAKARAEGRALFYEDGSLLKRAVEVLGEPVPEPER